MTLEKPKEKRKKAAEFLKKLLKTVERLEKDREELLESHKRILKNLNVQLDRHAKRNDHYVLEMERKIAGLQKVLDQTLYVTQNVGETLCNVLLAIRQNEYYQAYYPAQGGAPEQKVVGSYIKGKGKAAESA